MKIKQQCSANILVRYAQLFPEPGEPDISAFRWLMRNSPCGAIVSTASAVLTDSYANGDGATKEARLRKGETH